MNADRPRRDEPWREVSAPVDPASVVPAADPEAFARKILLDQLTGRARSRAELAGRLATRGVPDDLAGRLLDRFEEVGLVDDRAYAREWVRTRQAGRGLARRALAQQLRRKGVDPDVVAEALDEVGPEAELQAARELVRRRLRSVARLERQTAMRRLTGVLARKGHSPGVAFRVVREELAALDGVVDDAIGSDDVVDVDDVD